MVGVRSYRDLLVWQQAMTLGGDCYRATKIFPQSEIYGMTSQIRRSAASIPANIAEGNGRDNIGEYLHSLRIAQGSLKELETHVLLCTDVGLLPKADCDQILDQCESVGKLLRLLIRSLQERRSEKRASE